MADAVKELLAKVEDEEVRDQLSEQFESLSGSTLRKQLDEVLGENKTLKQEKRVRAYKDAGIPEGAHDVFDQVYDGELSVDGLQAFAKEKGFALPDGTQPEGGGDPEPDPGAGDDRLEQLQGGTLPAGDPSETDKAAQALADGDIDAAIRHNLAAQRKQT